MVFCCYPVDDTTIQQEDAIPTSIETHSMIDKVCPSCHHTFMKQSIMNDVENESYTQYSLQTTIPDSTSSVITASGGFYCMKCHPQLIPDRSTGMENMKAHHMTHDKGNISGSMTMDDALVVQQQQQQQQLDQFKETIRNEFDANDTFETNLTSIIDISDESLLNNSYQLEEIEVTLEETNNDVLVVNQATINDDGFVANYSKPNEVQDDIHLVENITSEQVPDSPPPECIALLGTMENENKQNTVPANEIVEGVGRNFTNTVDVTEIEFNECGEEVSLLAFEENFQPLFDIERTRSNETAVELVIQQNASAQNDVHRKTPKTMDVDFPMPEFEIRREIAIKVLAMKMIQGFSIDNNNGQCEACWMPLMCNTNGEIMNCFVCRSIKRHHFKAMAKEAVHNLYVSNEISTDTKKEYDENQTEMNHTDVLCSTTKHSNSSVVLGKSQDIPSDFKMDNRKEVEPPLERTSFDNYSASCEASLQKHGSEREIDAENNGLNEGNNYTMTPKTEENIIQDIPVAGFDYETMIVLARKEIGKRTLTGWTLLDKICPRCIMPLMTDVRHVVEICVFCEICAKSEVKGKTKGKTEDAEIANVSSNCLPTIEHQTIGNTVSEIKSTTTSNEVDTINKAEQSEICLDVTSGTEIVQSQQTDETSLMDTTKSNTSNLIFGNVTKQQSSEYISSPTVDHFVILKSSNNQNLTLSDSNNLNITLGTATLNDAKEAMNDNDLNITPCAESLDAVNLTVNESLKYDEAVILPEKTEEISAERENVMSDAGGKLDPCARNRNVDIIDANTENVSAKVIQTASQQPDFENLIIVDLSMDCEFTTRNSREKTDSYDKTLEYNNELIIIPENKDAELTSEFEAKNQDDNNFECEISEDKSPLPTSELVEEILSSNISDPCYAEVKPTSISPINAEQNYRDIMEASSRDISTKRSVSSILPWIHSDTYSAPSTSKRSDPPASNSLSFTDIFSRNNRCIAPPGGSRFRSEKSPDGHSRTDVRSCSPVRSLSPSESSDNDLTSMIENEPKVSDDVQVLDDVHFPSNKSKTSSIHEINTNGENHADKFHDIACINVEGYLQPEEFLQPEKTSNDKKTEIGLVDVESLHLTYDDVDAYRVDGGIQRKASSPGNSVAMMPVMLSTPSSVTSYKSHAFAAINDPVDDTPDMNRNRPPSPDYLLDISPLNKIKSKPSDHPIIDCTNGNVAKNCEGNRANSPGLSEAPFPKKQSSSSSVHSTSSNGKSLISSAQRKFQSEYHQKRQRSRRRINPETMIRPRKPGLPSHLPGNPNRYENSMSRYSFPSSSTAFSKSNTENRNLIELSSIPSMTSANEKEVPTEVELIKKPSRKILNETRDEVVRVDENEHFDDRDSDVVKDDAIDALLFRIEMAKSQLEQNHDDEYDSISQYQLLEVIESLTQAAEQLQQQEF